MRKKLSRKGGKRRFQKFIASRKIIPWRWVDSNRKVSGLQKKGSVCGLARQLARSAALVLPPAGSAGCPMKEVKPAKRVPRPGSWRGLV
jgi:hypothetical protein